MFQNIRDYMNLSREKRREHLKLDEDCIMIGGSTSVQYKGLLAHFLKTTIPHGFKDKTYLCHACNNSKCSNPFHLYWGTPSDNMLDQKEAGTYSSPYERSIQKHGLEKTKEFVKKGSTSGSKSGGGHNRLTEIELKVWEEAILTSNLEKFGWVQEVSKKLNRTHTQVRRIIKKYFPHVRGFQRKSCES